MGVTFKTLNYFKEVTYFRFILTSFATAHLTCYEKDSQHGGLVVGQRAHRNRKLGRPRLSPDTIIKVSSNLCLTIPFIMR